MVRYAVHYGFVQRFPFPAKQAYDWCTDYESDDLARMGQRGTRTMRWVDDSTVILDDTVMTDGRLVTKRRLVKLFPEQLFWTNIRLSASNKYSQFLYRIVPEGERRSRLEFTGAQVNEAKRKPTPKQIAALSDEYAKEDSADWVLLANEMKKDLSAR
jgi:hypothetical protein